MTTNDGPFTSSASLFSGVVFSWSVARGSRSRGLRAGGVGGADDDEIGVMAKYCADLSIGIQELSGLTGAVPTKIKSLLFGTPPSSSSAAVDNGSRTMVDGIPVRGDGWASEHTPET